MQIIDIIFMAIPDILEKGSQAVQIAVTTNGLADVVRSCFFFITIHCKCSIKI